VQGSGSWKPPTGTLGRILEEAKVRVSALMKDRARLERAAASAPITRNRLRQALRVANVAVVAEVKRKSPSKGWISRGMPAVDLASRYEFGGAGAISILTEPAHFDGSIKDLQDVSAAVGIPVLKKDFHIDPIQIVEARAYGATAVLLIARALGPGKLEAMISATEDLGLEALVEVRDEAELERALKGKATIVGVNNRDLETLAIEPSTAERLLPRIPADVIAIAESGMASIADVKRVAKIGADAVLVGSSLSASTDPALLVRQMGSVMRVAR
jgi:indole-3-glycerol phosphate synthase